MFQFDGFITWPNGSHELATELRPRNYRRCNGFAFENVSLNMIESQLHCQDDGLKELQRSLTCISNVRKMPISNPVVYHGV